MNGSHNLLTTPSASQFADPALRPLLDRLPRRRGRHGIAEERARIFRLAWDFVGTALAGRNEQYERFYLGSAGRNLLHAQQRAIGGAPTGWLTVSCTNRADAGGARLAARNAPCLNSPRCGDHCGTGGTMKIEKVETLQADAGWRMFSFLKVTTDDGIIGWSEFNESFGSVGPVRCDPRPLAGADRPGPATLRAGHPASARADAAVARRASISRQSPRSRTRCST